MSQDSEDDGLSAAISSHWMRYLAWRVHFDARVRGKIHRLSHRAEHYGIIAIAAVDAFHWHNLLFTVSIWLLITGLVVELVGGFE